MVSFIVDAFLGTWDWAALTAFAFIVAGTVLSAAAAAAWFREYREHRRLTVEETQRICDYYLNARAEVAYLEAKFAAQEAEEPW